MTRAGPAERRQRTYLRIDFDMKDHAKHHGARWDAERKRWYVLGDVPDALMNYVNGEAEPLKAALDRLGVNVKAAADRKREAEAEAQRAATTMRKPPAGDEQADFFVPALYDVSTKDNRSIMDVAVFRLSKKDKRAGEVIRYELPDGYVEVSAGPAGMASVWDYDIVLMMVSHLTEAMNRHRDGKGDRPGRIFRPHVSEILKFCRKGDGGKQSDDVEGALDRLKATSIKIVRNRPGKGGRTMREVEAEGLLSSYRAVSYTDTGKMASVEIEAPNWIYREVIESRQPEVLTVHRDYFLIEPGIGRFVYRLARRAAGKTQARWSFQTIYERSGSAGTFKEFCRLLRRIIEANDLPEYALAEEPGQEGPLLVMQNRAASLVGNVRSDEGENAATTASDGQNV